MANLNAPKGFVLSRTQRKAMVGNLTLYVVLAAEANQINPGDAVKSAGSMDANGIPAVTKITNGTDAVRGVVSGVLAANPNAPSRVGTNLDLTVQNIPATKAKDYYVLVADDPDCLFEVQDDGLNLLTVTAATKNASFTVTNPTAPGQNSATVLTTASVATTQGLNLKLQGLIQRADNVLGLNAKWLVSFNQHELGGPNTAGI